MNITLSTKTKRFGKLALTGGALYADTHAPILYHYIAPNRKGLAAIHPAPNSAARA